MRVFSDAVKQQLQQDHISTFYLIEWTARNGNDYAGQLRHTTFPYDLTITNLGKIFKALNGLSGLDAPRISNSVDRETFKISYIDPDMQMINWINSNGGVGTKCKAWIGFINTVLYEEGYLLGQPMLHSNDLIVSYAGVLDTYGFSIDADGNFTSTFECSSPMAALDIVRPQLTSPFVARARFTTDACYDQVHSSSAPVTIHWGSIA